MAIFPNPFRSQPAPPSVRISLVEPQYVQRSEDPFADLLFEATSIGLLREQLRALSQIPCAFPTETLGPEVNLEQAEPLSESSEVRWLRTNNQEVARHQGEWLLIANGALVAASSDFRDIKDAIERKRIRSPFVYYVPTEEESSFTLIIE